MAARTVNWIFVTGAPRSGTTYVGRVLSIPFGVGYVQEPFNPDNGLPGFNKHYSFLKEGKKHHDLAINSVDRLFEFKAKLRPKLYEKDGQLKTLAKRLMGSRANFEYQLAAISPFTRSMILKCPVGCLMTDFLFNRYAVKPVILIRHPISFVSSIKRLGWNVGLHDLLDKDLHQKYFSCWPDTYFETNSDTEKIAKIWTALNSVLLQQKERQKDWIVIRHEDLSMNPREIFHSLFNQVGLPWTDRVSRFIDKTTSVNNPVSAQANRAHDFIRNSAEIGAERMKSTTIQERRIIFDIAGEVAAPYYSEASFELKV